MIINHTIRYALSLFLITTLLSIGNVSAGESIGKLIFTIGKVQVIDASGKHKRARRGADIFQGDTIKTFVKGQAQIKFVDGARISIRANSEFKVDAYVYSENPDKDKSEMSLIRGGIRAVTGAIGKKNKKSYKMKTAVATIGIRGTDYSLMLCQSNCKDEVNATVNSGLYVGVVNGGVTVSNQLGSITLDKNQYATVGSFNIKPRMLLKPPSFLMFDKIKASRKDLIEFANNFDKKSDKKETLKSAKSPSTSQTQKLSTLASNQLGSSSTNALPSSIAKRIDGRNSQIPTEVATQLKNLFINNSDKLSAIDQELVEGLKKEFSNAETTEEINEVIERNSDEIAKISEFIKDEGISLDVAGDCSSLFSSSCDNFSDIIGNDPNSIITDDNSATTIGDGSSSTPTPLQVTRLSRFFTSSLVNDGSSFEYATENNADNQLTSFYRADSSDLSLYSYSDYGLETAIVEEYGYDPDTGLSWGRWSNGNIAKTLHTTDNSSLESLDFNSQSLHWVQGMDGSDNIQLPITGTRDFTLIGNTRPTDNLGNIGTLGAASLFANFETNTVDADVTLSINQQLWRGGQQDISLDRSTGRFLGNQLNIQVFDATGSTTGTGGQISGGLITSPTNAGAFSYSLDANTNGQDTTVSGTAVFSETKK